MRSFRRVLAGLAGVLLILLVSGFGGRILYEPCTGDGPYAKRELDAYEGLVDTVFIGASYVHQGISISDFDETAGTVSFNLGTMAQPLEGSLALLADTWRDNPLRQVFLGVSPVSFTKDMSQGTAEKLEVYDRLRHWKTKLSYLFASAQGGEWWQYLWYPARVENVLDVEQIKENVSYKYSARYQQGLPPKSRSSRYSRGQKAYYQVYDGSLDKEDVLAREQWREELFHQENVDTLRELCDFCREKEIELNLVVFPTTEDYRSCLGDMEAMDAWLQAFAEEGVTLYNYLAPQWEGWFPDSYFQDRKHLNVEGSEIFTKMLAEEWLK